jgi:hypothetical protein
MKKLLINTTCFIFLSSLIVFFAGCNGDDDGEEMGGNDLIGTWEVTNAEVDAMVGSQSLTDYFINVGGLSPENAAIAYTLFETFFLAELDGTIQFLGNNTYLSNFGNQPDDGTWSLSSDGKTLTLDGGTVDEIVITINSLTSTSANLTFSQDLEEDLDDDPETPDVPIDVTVDLTLAKM